MSQALQILVQLVSVRRSLFSTTERKTYLQSIMDGIKKVIERQLKLKRLFKSVG